MRYIRQLDALRAIAVLFVIISHWLPAGSLINKSPNGLIGVNIFFVLSGFLITRILLQNRKDAKLNGLTGGALVSNFYIRRTLRIFPIYYLAIFLLLIFHNHTGTDIKDTYPWYLTYTSNFYFFKAGHWDSIFSPLWSLAVEEQFYLFWPWLILFINRRYLKSVIILSIAVGLLSQYLLRNNAFGTILMPSCLDSFGLGALLSWVLVFEPESSVTFYRRVSIAAAASFLICLATFGWHQKPVIFIPGGTFISIIALWLITWLVRNQDNEKFHFGFIFNNRVLIYLGRISYGLYLYHEIIPSVLNSRFVDVYFNPHLPEILTKRYWGILYLTENIVLLLTIASLSYFFIELPILKLKRHFVLKKGAAPAKATISF